MKVWIYKTFGNYDEDGEITKVFSTKKMAEQWDKRMKELQKLHEKYHKDGTVTGSTSECPEIIKLQEEAGSENYMGQIIERCIDY